jgi:hypothetical protein
LRRRGVRKKDRMKAERPASRREYIKKNLKKSSSPQRHGGHGAH